MAENQSDATILKDVAEGNLGAQPQTMTKKGLLQRICIGSAIVCSNFVTPVVQRFGVRAQKLIFQQMSSDPNCFTIRYSTVKGRPSDWPPEVVTTTALVPSPVEGTLTTIWVLDQET